MLLHAVQQGGGAGGEGGSEAPQVMDVGGVSLLQMGKHIRSTDNQAEFDFNSLYAPETLGRVRHCLPRPFPPQPLPH